MIRNNDVQELKKCNKINDSCSDIGIVHLFHLFMLDFKLKEGTLCLMYIHDRSRFKKLKAKEG